MAEQPADLVERVVFVAAAAEGVLLDAAADLVDDLGAEPDHVEGVEDGDRVGQPVADRVRISAERVQRGLLHAVDEPVGLGLQPGLVDGAGAADDGVEQPGVQASGLVTGQIDHDRDGPVDPDPRRPPDVLIDPEGLHPGQPGRVADAGLGFDLDRVPAGVPVHAEMPGQRRDGGVVVAERVGRPAHRPDRQHHPRRRQIVGLAERRRRARRFSAAPDPHQPAHQRDPAEARRIVQHPDPAAVADREHPARRAAASSWPDSTVSTSRCRSSISTSRTCMPGTSKIASARAHQRAPEPHIE